jgi:predicted nucleotidyltransferase
MGTYTIDEIKKITVPVARKFGVKKLALFGSYATGKQKPGSDMDFLIEKGDICGWEFFGFINNLEEELDVSVDVLTYQSLEDSFIADAVENEVVLYER